MATKKNTNLAALRAGIAALQAEHGRLTGTDRDRGDAAREIAAYVAAQAGTIDARLHYATQTGIDTGLLLVRARPDGQVDLGPVLAAILGPDALAAALSRFIGELPPAGSKAERLARLAEINAELDEVEDAEEVEVCRLEAQGLTVDRRASARPEIVLAIRN